MEVIKYPLSTFCRELMTEWCNAIEGKLSSLGILGVSLHVLRLKALSFATQ